LSSIVSNKDLHSYMIWPEILLGLLFFQFVLGMWANLFATFPAPPSHPQQGFAVAQQILNSGLPVVIIHAINGIIMLGISTLSAVRGRETRHKNIFAISLIGLLAVAVSVCSGYHFVYSGWVDNVYSYSMSLGFIVAFVSNFFRSFAYL
jgi:hypothetical protein